jgi:hypothetical protein
MEPEGPLPFSQMPATGPYPEPVESSPETIRCILVFRRMDRNNIYMDVLMNKLEGWKDLLYMHRSLVLAGRN